MKFLICLVIISVFVLGIYYLVDKTSKKTKKSKKVNWRAFSVSAVLAVVLCGFLTLIMYEQSLNIDTWCTTIHTTTSVAPAKPKTAMDFFTLGDYDFSTGNCVKAVQDYTKSIKINPKYPQAYNNRAYTYMRIRDYKDALVDLDQAITLNPSYSQALMNRADIHNYYFGIDRQSAILDYQKVISLGGQKTTSVCGHLFLAQHNGWNLGNSPFPPHGLL